MLNSVRVPSCVVALVLAAVSGVAAFGQGFAKPVDRIVRPIDENQVVTLTGNVHPMAQSEFDLGPVAGEQVLERMVLQLEPSEAQQAELDALVEAQHDPASPLYHQWLTPAEYGERFGASAADVARVTAWLRGHGFTVNEVAASNRLVIFSGTSGEVADTFHTELHRYNVLGQEHIANAQDPQIPEAFAGVVGGVLSLHDFRRTSEIRARESLGARPQYSAGSTHYLFPADWATIYDLNSLYSAGKTGTGTSIAIVGRSDINLPDVTQFRAASGLPANAPKVILVSTDPGLLEGDQDESTLDVEWGGAIAPSATVNFVVGASTETTDGVDLSAQYIVNHATATVVSTSYGSCEQYMGSTELSFYNSLWQQAASEGISAFVSSGDSGAAGCNGGSSTTGTMAGVNGLCSSPYSTCVGGTEFSEGSNPAEYWSATNSASYESALSYIPEKVWNESALDGGSGLWASTGGASVAYTQPSWQKGVSGTSFANGMRAVPDVAMAAASHDGYIIVEDGSMWVIAGTSAASPSFAGVMALVVQSQGGKGQGNANPGLYAMLNAGTTPFHATPSGNNTVPGVTGFTASGGPYNLDTGLGSVDGALLVKSWGAAAVPSLNFALTQSATSGTVVAGKTATFTIGVTESGAAKNAVALSVKAATGVTATISPASITPGISATVTLTVASTCAAGAQSVTVTGSNSSGTQTLTYALTVTQPPTLALTAASGSAAMAQGGTGTVSLTATTGGSFTGNISWSVSGLPSGVTAAWSANPLSPSLSASSNAETLTLSAALTAAIASSTITVTATGDSLTATQKVTLQVTQAAGITLAVSSASVSVQSLATATVTVTATPQGGAKVPTGAVGSSISVASGLPSGFTASWSLPTINSAGVVTWTLTLAGSSSAVAGSSTLNLSASIAAANGSTYKASTTLPMAVTLTPPTLTETTASSSLVVGQGTSVADLVTLAGNGTFNGAVTLSVSGLPAGVTASWSGNPVTLSSESGTSTVTLTVSSTATVGSVTVTVTAKGDGLTVTKTIALQVQQTPAVALVVAPGSVSMQSLGTSTVTVTATPLSGFTVASRAAGSSIGVQSGLPKGFTASWSAPSVTNAGAVVWTLTLTGSPAAAAGNATLNLSSQVVSAKGSTVTSTATLPIAVTLTPPTLTITPASSSLSAIQGKSGTDVLTIAGNGTYTGMVSLAVSGLPTGVTATWSSSAVTLASETGTSTLTLTAASTTKVGSATITVTASGDAVTATKQVTLQVTQALALQVALSVSTLSMSHAASSSFIVTMTELGGLNVQTSLMLGGLPAGVTPSLSNVNLTASGNESGTITLTGSSAAKAGTSVLTIGVIGTSNGITYTANQTLSLQLK